MSLLRVAVFVATVSIAVSEKDDGLSFDYSVVCARNTTDGNVRNFCSATYPELKALSSSTCEDDPQGFAGVVDLFEVWDACDPTTVPVEDVPGHLILLNSTDACPFDQRLETLEALNAKGMLLITGSGHVPILRSNRTSAGVSVIAISEKTLKKLRSMGDSLEVNAFVPKRGFDPSLLVVLGMAVFSVAVGAYWSGHYRYKLYNKQCARRAEKIKGGSGAARASGEAAPNKAKHREEEAVSIDLTPVTVVFLVLAMCGMLVLLYFFYQYLIYLIIAIYCMAACFGLSVCLDKLASLCVKCSCPVRLCSWFKDPNTGEPIQLEVRRIVLLVVAASVTIVWAVFRHETWSWILQDLLGVAFSINLLRIIRLGSLKIISLLLGLLFFYDIFFVFITPYLTKDGSSVMVQVATGGDSSGMGEGGRAREPLPMVLKVPHLAFNPLSVCGISNASLLGFGDILCPGLLVAYCHYFDLKNGNRFRIYYVVEVICYALGMVATFISLFLMEEAQPALLYLVPFTVIPAVILSLARKEFKDLWHGDDEAKKNIYPDDDQLNSCNSSQNGDDSCGSDAEAGSDEDPTFQVQTDPGVPVGTDGGLQERAASRSTAANAPAAVI